MSSQRTRVRTPEVIAVEQLGESMARLAVASPALHEAIHVGYMRVMLQYFTVAAMGSGLANGVPTETRSAKQRKRVSDRKPQSGPRKKKSHGG